jgi:mRNA interferase MazF
MAKVHRIAPRAGGLFPRRGEIYLTKLDPTVGHEIQKTRPALIVQNDINNRNSPVTIVAPITSKVRSPLSLVQVLLNATSQTGLSVASVVLFNHIRAVDRVRLIRRLGSVDDETMELVDEAIKISLGVTKLD